MKIKLLDNFYSVISRKKMLLFLGVFLSLIAFGQQSISSLTAPYQQNFNALGTANVTVTGGNLNLKDAALNGWYFNETASNANTIISAGTGSSGTGDTYNFGTSGGADRTLGSLVSSNLGSSYGFYFKNTTGVTVTSIKISYTGKTWRVGSANRSDRLQFQYSTGATSLTSGTWVDFASLDYANPGQAVTTTFGSVQHSAVITATITGLSIANNANFFIRWTDIDASGADDGMGIDDFNLILNPYSVTYNGNSQTSGSVPVDANSPYVHGATVTVLGNTGNLARTGYTFAGWNTLANGSGTNYVAGNTFTINANTILYAKWNVNCAAPTVSSTTTSANNSTTGADLTGSVTAIGGANVSEVGFNYSTSSTLTSPLTASNTGLSISTVPYSISKSLTGLQANTLYYYRAYAVNSCATPQTSYSHTSGYPSFTTISLAPVSTAADNILTDSFRANWTAPASQGSAAFTYHLQIDDNIDFSSPIYDNQNEAGLNHTQTSLLANTTYYYRVAVRNGGGQSEWSSTQTVTTSASNKPLVTASNFNGTVNVSFSQNILATNIPDSYAIVAGSSLPAGLSLNTTTGAITGTPTTAGTFTTNVTATKGAETSDPTAITFTIAKGSQTITGLPVALTKIYGDADYTLSATASSGLTVTYTSSNTAVATVTGSTVKIVGVGNVNIIAHQVGDENWNAAPDAIQALAVNRKEISITGLSAASKVYDQNTSVVVTGTPVYSGLANGDNFAVTGTVTWAFANKNAENNKELVRTGTYNEPSANYTVVQPVLQASITKKNIVITSITANDKVYDASTTATFSNIGSTDVFAGDVITFTGAGTFSDANAGLNKDVNVLAIDLSGADAGNYNIPVLPSGLKANISKADQWIVLAAIPVLNTGSTADLGTYATVLSGLPLSYSSSTPGIASVSGQTLTANNAGTTVLTVSQEGNNNYNPATSLQQTITVVDVPVALAQWDFFGLSAVATAPATAKSSELSSNPILSRGPGATASAGDNSFRTQGFRNDGISVSNTDYFQTSFTATNQLLSLTSLRAKVFGTGTFVESPGVDVQFAYSFSPNSNYVLINAPVKVIGNTDIPEVNLAGVTALQNIAPGTTVYFRFYASGRTTTGGYGFNSTASGDYGLQFFGRFKPTQIIWNGSEWSNFNGPDKAQNAIIDGAFTKTSANNPLEVNNLTITNNGSLTIEANQGVTVNGDITMPDDKITIESDGSLVQTKLSNGNSNNKAIAKRMVNMKTLDYTYWSSPLKDQVLLNTLNINATNSSGGFSPGTPNNRIYEYNEVNDKFRGTADSTFVPAKGYAIRGKAKYGNTLKLDTLSFRGNLHNGDYTIQIQKSKNTLVGGISTEHGYNLIGNPYPSNIDFDKFHDLDNGTGVKNSTLILGKAWFWTNIPGAPATQGGSAYTANNYATYSLSGGAPATSSDDIESPIPTKFIKVAQGFIVQMRTAAPTVNTPNVGTLKFNNSIRSNDSSSYFYNNNKQAESGLNRYWVKLVAPNNVANTILLAHLDNASNDYDPDYDAELLTVGDDSFYSKLNAQKLQIQARNNPLNNNDVINLGTKYSMNGTYKIKLGNREGVFKSTQKIYLLDKLNNTYTDITSQDYTFTASKGLDENRFEIVYKNNEVLGTDSTKKSDFTVYRDAQEFVITSSKALGKVEVYDAAGRLVVSLKTANDKIRLDAATFTNGVYIIKAENSGDVKTKKIIK